MQKGLRQAQWLKGTCVNHHDLHGVGSLHRLLFHYNVVGSETRKQPKQAQESPRSKVRLKQTSQERQHGLWSQLSLNIHFSKYLSRKTTNIWASYTYIFTNQDLEIRSFPDVVHLYQRHRM